MSAGDEGTRTRLLVRLRRHFATRRSPRATMSVILMITGAAGFGASVGMLKCGLGQMGVRYPLAVLFAWGTFLVLVRLWAVCESESFRMEDHIGDPAQLENIPSATPPSRSSGQSGRDIGWGWLNWLDVGDLFGGEIEGCLVGIAFLILAIAVVGTLVTLAGLIGEAEALFAELFLDAVLISALSKRLRRLKPRWWVAGVLRQTIWPVVLTAISLTIVGFLLQLNYPNAKSIGAVWRHDQPAPPAGIPQLERER